MLKKPTKKKLPSLKEQLSNIALAVVQIQKTLNETLPTLATKTELAEIKQRLAILEGRFSGLEGQMDGKADKTDIVRLEKNIDELNEHITNLLTKYMDSHAKIHEKIEERFVKLETMVK